MSRFGLTGTGPRSTNAPASITVPPQRTIASASTNVSATPEQSTTRSAPRPPVAPRNAPTASSRSIRAASIVTPPPTPPPPREPVRQLRPAGEQMRRALGVEAVPVVLEALAGVVREALPAEPALPTGDVRARNDAVARAQRAAGAIRDVTAGFDDDADVLVP